MHWRAFFIALTLCISGCASIGNDLNDPLEYRTVEDYLAEADFLRQNQPVRTLEVLLVIDETTSEHIARSIIESASHHLDRQIGVRLRVSRVETVVWGTRSFGGIHRELKALRKRYPGHDIVIGVTLRDEEWFDDCPPRTNCAWGKTYEWRNIVLRKLYPEVLAHEVGHTLTPGKIFHSPKGLMTATDNERYLSIRDRERMLRNKWRDYRAPISWFERLIFSF